MGDWTETEDGDLVWEESEFAEALYGSPDLTSDLFTAGTLGGAFLVLALTVAVVLLLTLPPADRYFSPRTDPPSADPPAPVWPYPVGPTPLSPYGVLPPGYPVPSAYALPPGYPSPYPLPPGYLICPDPTRHLPPPPPSGAPPTPPETTSGS